MKVLRQILKTKETSIKVGKKSIGSGYPAYIITEAGVNHNGDINLAIKLIKAAARAGADAIKFQTFKAEQVTTRQSPTASYQKKNVGENNQWKLLHPLELKEKDYPKLIKECTKASIEFMSTPHGHIESAQLLDSMVKVWKVGSGDLTNLPFLEYLGKTKKPIILSTGMATIKEIKEAVKIIEKTGNNKIVILQCTTNYPCPPEEANVSAVLDLMRNFPKYLIGFSDHTMGYEADLMAVGYGATVIEKHFTLDCNLPGPDQKNSLEPQELSEMVRKIRLVESLRGTGIKKPFQSELVIAEMARKSVISKKDIKKGQMITEKMLTIKRPAKGGLCPKEYWNILGKKAKRDIKADTQLKKGDF
ncbi:N-acetylneuraminate synthase [Patescibacteria group bacterium]|nr:N-acetylneuraminate synthase [Patescibacteria group bacterium]